MKDFQGRAFHTARWDYEYTGGGPNDPHLTKLADKVVGVIGAGASAIQAVPPLGESAKHVYLFQRTPSAIGERGNRPTEGDFVKHLHPGWQKERMENFSAATLGLPVKRDLVEDGWTKYSARLNTPPTRPGMSPEELAVWVEQSDYGIMEEHRKRIEGIVADARIAEMLKPYYRYQCKRPCFHDEYLAAFNNPKVTIVDCPAGVTKITPHGVIANGVEYRLDCIVYATGFEAEATPFPRRAGHPIIGRGGITIKEKWKDGVVSLHGLATRGFPNLFIMPVPSQQSVTTVNYTHLVVIGADHIAATIAKLDERGIDVFDVSEAAENAWTETIVNCFRDTRDFMAACTPSRLNYEGHPEAVNPRNGSYGGGRGDVFGYQELLAKWRRDDFPGWEIIEGAQDAR
jgi:cation diffusion facilitator CzcD-associated flavoprotein CzcO